ncbi:GMC oxidoreductase [Streptomyces broussonetiae]|uniref:Cholesterol oxidase n=1 Tax=Streptomyces broussonetiae TaxID=2686304 RepID=A0ABV5EMH8_9ACTN
MTDTIPASDSAPATGAEARPDREERHGVVIVGCGLGGSITAFRLAEAGVRNVVLERGRRWPLHPASATFPVFPSIDSRLVWLDDESTPFPPLRSAPWSRLFDAVEAALPRSTGLLDVIAQDRAVIVCGAGVGGGTLVYGGVLAQPRPEAFHRIFPVGPDYEELVDVHYPRARRRLGGALFPADLLDQAPYRAHRLWDEAIQASGLPSEPVCGAFDHNALREELAGTRPPAAIVGQYHFTACDSGARISADRTYLARAEATGRTSVRPLHRVTALAADRAGGYRVHTEHLAEGGTPLERVIFRCDRLVMAAGVHTPRLLLAARETGGLGRLHPSVGEGWGANGDHVALLQTESLPPDLSQGGPSSTVAHDETGTVGLMHSPLPVPVDGGGLVCLGMGVPGHTGAWRWTADGGTRLDWDPAGDTAGTARIEEVMRRVAQHLPEARLTPLSSSRPVVAHAAGGARLGEACDAYGRLRGHPGLYCLDGALLPGGAGAVNPALTIAAIAEHCLDHIVTDFLG